MVPRMSERLQAIVFVVVLAVAISGLYAYIQLSQPPPVTASGVEQVSLFIDGGTWTISYGPVETSNNTAYSLLLEASTRLGFPVQAVQYSIPNGVFVTSINGTTNGQDGRYWQFWVDGTYPQVGADHVALADGDTVTWRFTSDQGGTL
ncbi:MAG TPA: DUF4430 domain-containing protein [Thermoplasmata archaeon]|nr:DUF4430 domain-containing protein [Thermoplasmata archaeon]